MPTSPITSVSVSAVAGLFWTNYECGFHVRRLLSCRNLRHAVLSLQVSVTALQECRYVHFEGPLGELPQAVLAARKKQSRLKELVRV